MRKPSRLLVVAMSCFASWTVLAAGEPKPNKETVLALAAKHRKVREASLDFKSKRIIGEINQRLASTKSVPALQKQLIDGLVNELTIALAGLKKLDTLIVASSILVQTAPGNPRTRIGSTSTLPSMRRR